MCPDHLISYKTKNGDAWLSEDLFLLKPTYQRVAEYLQRSLNTVLFKLTHTSNKSLNILWCLSFLTFWCKKISFIFSSNLQTCLCMRDQWRRVVPPFHRRTNWQLSERHLLKKKKRKSSSSSKINQMKSSSSEEKNSKRNLNRHSCQHELLNEFSDVSVLTECYVGAKKFHKKFFIFFLLPNLNIVPPKREVVSEMIMN
jgi:hypothetical protein